MAASLAATYYEPVYQRLRQWHNGQMVQLLGFVRETGATVRQVLDEAGAAPSRDFRANCFAEVWEWSRSDPTTCRGDVEAAELDRKISEALGCQAGRYSASAGMLRWSDNADEPHQRRHVASTLVQQSQPKNRSR